MKDLIALQIEHEEQAYNTSLDKFDKELRKKIENGTFVDSKEAIILFRASIDCIVDYLDKYKKLTSLNQGSKSIRDTLFQAYPKPHDLAFMMLRCVISIVIEGETKSLFLAKRVGTLAQQYIRTAILARSEVDLVEKHNRKFKRYSIGRRRAKLISLSSSCVSLDIDQEKNILLGTTIVDIINKSGSGLLQHEQRTDALYIKLSQDAMGMLVKSKAFFGSFITVHYPFVVTPRPWKELLDSGGYYTNKQIKFIRTRNFKDFSFIDTRHPKLDRLMEVINKIQDTPFRINKRVLDVINYIDKHHIVDPNSSKRSPYLIGKLPISEPLNPYEVITKDDYKESKEYYRAIDIQKELIERMKSKRIGFDLALTIANRFTKYEKIYFSYNTDFRGRLYPIQQYLSPQGNDISKSMLEFGTGYKLTEEGFYWLKIHGANCKGFDKLTYTDRIIQIEESHNEIMAVYEDPLGNLKYWCDVDSPLLYLSFCFAYGDYIRDKNSLCYSVVHLDGTCSGIQMYSGLLRDKEGARAVNVINNDSRTVSDIYGVVAKEVENLLETNDYSREYSFTTKGGRTSTVTTLLEAHSIKGKVTRSLTKRNVMTQPYSVTRRGMFEQVYNLLQEYEEDNKVFWQGDKWTLSMLLSELNDKAICKIVKGAKEGQKILKDILAESLKTNDYAYWKTPIFEFPILQRIKKEKRRQLRTPLGQLVLYSPTEETHQLRMLNGIAPNFVHSLDATVLYRTVEICMEEGVNEFWLIHDSYGTHPNNIPTLNRAFRTAYVDVFSTNPLVDFANQIEPSMVEEVEKVMLNTLNLEEVLSSDYIIT